MAGLGCSGFSEDGKYFAYSGADGKLKVWETESGILSQEYTPNLHLSSPCTCLTWVASRNSVSHVEHQGSNTSTDFMHMKF
jgi:U3 small nucleolar RNA-associated protein 5